MSGGGYGLLQGDLLPDMLIELEAPGAIAALVDAQDVRMTWKKPDGTISSVALFVVDEVEGLVKRVWQTGDSAQIGTHHGIVVVTAANGETTSDPNTGATFCWKIRARPL